MFIMFLTFRTVFLPIIFSFVSVRFTVYLIMVTFVIKGRGGRGKGRKNFNCK